MQKNRGLTPANVLVVQLSASDAKDGDRYDFDLFDTRTSCRKQLCDLLPVLGKHVHFIRDSIGKELCETGDAWLYLMGCWRWDEEIVGRTHNYQDVRFLFRKGCYVI